MQEILQKISPSKEERKKLESTVASFLKILNSKLKEAKAILGGSGAKDTWLSGNHDVDIFVQFDYPKFKDKSEQLSGLLEKALKKSFPKHHLETLQGSRDYFQFSYEGIDFEVVPSLNVKRPEDAQNITDLSHLHSGWVNKHTKMLKDDVRLAKQFCKANRVYGAESYIGGFSGYVLEILVAHYGSFNKLLQAATKWKEKEVIDPENHYPKKDALFHLNSSKQQSPIILIDPTDKNRNAAAALSLKGLNQFKKKAREYLNKPTIRFFEKEEITIESLKRESPNKKQHLILIAFESSSEKVDVAGAKMVKSFEYLEQQLSPFEIKKSGWEWDKDKKGFFYFLLEKDRQQEFELRVGPPLHLKDHVSNFKKEHPHVFEEKGKLYAKIKIEHPFLKDFLKHLIKEEYLLERIKKFSILSS